MSQQHEFFLARAAEARADAEAALLDNVKQRCLRSEAAWAAMAARAERTEKMRAKSEREKAAALEADMRLTAVQPPVQDRAAP